MKKILIISFIFLLLPAMAHAKNYKVIVNDAGNTDIISVTNSKKDANKQDLKINAGLSNNKGYIKIKLPGCNITRFTVP